MAYTITPYEKKGVGKISMAGTTQVTANTARGFRNVAVGATIKSTSIGTGGTATVTAKTDETHINVNVTDTFAVEDWTYINPVLTLTGHYYIKHSKSDKPTITPITLKDSDYAYGSVGAGVARGCPAVRVGPIGHRGRSAQGHRPPGIAHGRIADQARDLPILRGHPGQDQLCVRHQHQLAVRPGQAHVARHHDQHDGS